MTEYPPCKYCGASHGMGIETMETGEIEPVDVCKDCLFGDWITSIALEDLKNAEE